MPHSQSYISQGENRYRSLNRLSVVLVIFPTCIILFYILSDNDLGITKNKPSDELVLKRPRGSNGVLSEPLCVIILIHNIFLEIA